VTRTIRMRCNVRSAIMSRIVTANCRLTTLNCTMLMQKCGGKVVLIDWGINNREVVLEKWRKKITNDPGWTRTNSLCLLTLTFYRLRHKLYALYACKLVFLNNTATRALYKLLLQMSYYRIPFWGHISGADQDIFTKFVVCMENGVPQYVQRSTYARLDYPRWRTAAILN